MKKISLMITILLAMFFVIPIAFAENVELLWDANVEADLAGYKIFQGTPPNSWTLIATIACGPEDITCCEYTVENLTDGTYNWVATAFDDAGNESEYSDIATWTLDKTPPGKPINFRAQVVEAD